MCFHVWIEADSGEISVFVENEDTALHTFTIDELGVNLEVPGGETRRVAFEAGRNLRVRLSSALAGDERHAGGGRLSNFTVKERNPRPIERPGGIRWL